MKRYHQLETLNFISTELHKNFSPLFTPGTPEEYKDTVRNVLFNKFAYVDNVLANRLSLLEILLVSQMPIYSL